MTLVDEIKAAMADARDAQKEGGKMKRSYDLASLLSNAKAVIASGDESRMKDMLDRLKNVSVWYRKQYSANHRDRIALAAVRRELARMYPNYSLKELKAWLSDPSVPEETKKKAKQEISAREAGESKPRLTPQIAPGWKNGIQIVGK